MDAAGRSWAAGRRARGWLAVSGPVAAQAVLDAPAALTRAETGALVILDVRTIGEWAGQCHVNSVASARRVL